MKKVVKKKSAKTKAKPKIKAKAKPRVIDQLEQKLKENLPTIEGLSADEVAFLSRFVKSLRLTPSAEQEVLSKGGKLSGLLKSMLKASYSNGMREGHVNTRDTYHRPFAIAKTIVGSLKRVDSGYLLEDTDVSRLAHRVPVVGVCSKDIHDFILDARIAHSSDTSKISASLGLAQKAG